MKTKRTKAMMRNLTLICSAVLLMTSMTVVAKEAPTNLLKDYNPNFETMESETTIAVPTGLQLRTGAEFEKNLSHNGGANSVALKVKDAQLAISAKSVLKPATSYTLSFWMQNSLEKSLQMTGNDNRFTLNGTKIHALENKPDWFTPAFQQLPTIDFGDNETDPTWRKVCVDFTTPPSDCDGLNIILTAVLDDDKLVVDDFLLVESGKKPNFVFGGDFEALANNAEPLRASALGHWGPTYGVDDKVTVKADENGNHYGQLKKPGETSAFTYSALRIKGASMGKRYRVSMKYKVPAEEKPATLLRFNGGTDYFQYIDYFPGASANKWETFSFYIDATDLINAEKEVERTIWYGYTGQNAERYVDDLYSYYDANEIGFYKELTFGAKYNGKTYGFDATAGDASDWQQRYMTGDGGGGDVYFNGALTSEKAVELASLSNADTIEDGKRKVIARAHYIPKETGNTGEFEDQSVTMISAVYKKVNDKKQLVDIYVKNEVSKDGKVLDIVDTVYVPAGEAGEYSVEVMAWDDIKVGAPLIKKAILK